MKCILLESEKINLKIPLIKGQFLALPQGLLNRLIRNQKEKGQTYLSRLNTEAKVGSFSVANGVPPDFMLRNR